jgi:hypothetical protein
MKTRLLMLPFLIGACSANTTVNIVPAGQQPTGMTQPSMSLPMTLGSMPQGMPQMATAAPATPPAAPSSTTVVNNISINITNVISFAYDSGTECAAYDLGEGLAYCDDAMPHIVTMCEHGKVYFFDCGTYASDANCGYTFEGDGRVACVDTPKTKIADSIAADKAFAWQTEIPCTALDEGYAECQGSYAYYCSGGKVLAQDCGLYVGSDGAAASCGSTDGSLIDCHW